MVSEDAAVVLVLDVSNSMDKKDIQSVKEAARNFVEKLTDDASENAQRKVAIVEFGSNAKTVVGWTEANSSQGKNKIENGITAVENGFHTGENGKKIQEEQTLKVAFVWQTIC